MKEHINDMTTEQFELFGSVFAFAMVPELLHTTMKTNGAIAAVNDTIKDMKEDN